MRRRLFTFATDISDFIQLRIITKITTSGELEMNGKVVFMVHFKDAET